MDGTIATRYIWQSQYRLAAELNADGTLRKQFVYADGVNSPEYMIYQGKRYMFVKDHRGSVNLVVDVDTGTIAQKIEYSEFGEVLSDTNPGFQPFGFAGGLYDPDTKLVRFGARDYDGKLGRWLAKDPIRFDGGDENLYGYVLNDPVNLIDYNGKNPYVIFAIVCYFACGDYLSGDDEHTDYNPNLNPKVEPPHQYPKSEDKKDQHKKQKENKEFLDTVCGHHLNEVLPDLMDRSYSQLNGGYNLKDKILDNSQGVS